MNEAKIEVSGQPEDRHPWTVEPVHYDGVTIETLVQGSGPAIVIVPSMGRDGYGDYDEAASCLAALGFQVLRPQPRGVGSSKGDMKNVDLHDFSNDIAAVIKQLGKTRAVLVGHAFGHFISRMCATDHPDLVRGVVLAASSASDTATRYPDVWYSPTRVSDYSLSREERLAGLRLAFFAEGNDPTAWLDGWYDDVRDMQLAHPVPQSEWWQAGSAPLLEIIPEEDPFKPRDRWDELRRQFGDRVETVTIPRTSHALFPERPKEVAEAIARWCNTLAP